MKKWLCILAAFALAFSLASTLAAQEKEPVKDSKTEKTADLADEGEQKLSPEKLEKKKEGWYPTGLPLVNFSSDDGFGYGLRAYMYYNGERTDRYYDTAPYFLQLYAQYFATTNGVQYHELNADMPYFMGTKFRIKSAFVYEKNLNANFFGLGAKNANKPLTDNLGKEYDKYADYQKYIDDNEEQTKWYKYTLTKPKYYLYLFRNLPQHFKAMMGAEFKKANVDPWGGRKFDGTTMFPTYLETLGKDAVPGYDGGWTNYARFGIGWDTRDYEPDPNKGFYIDYCFEAATSLLGSEYDFQKNTAGARAYFNPWKPIVLAFRGAYTTASNDIPFYEMNQFGFALSRQNGLGGNRTLRGYKADRFVGKTMTLANAEIRGQFYEVSGAGQRFAFKLVAFFDSGNVYDASGDPFSDPRWGDYKNSYGGGLVIAWNLATIIHVYYGMSKEDTGLFINFEHNF